MDLGNNRLWIRVSSQVVVPSSAAPMQSSSSSGSSVPIIGIAVIVGTALLLVSYYVFVIKCRFSSLSNNNNNNNLLLLSPEQRGLDEAAIRSIPILNFNTTNHHKLGSRDFCECAVCLNEFQEDEKLRFIPQCGHVFHIDCIDIWLLNNANCPLCRTSVSHLPLDQMPTTTRHQASNNNAVFRSEEDYVVIELGEPSTSPPPPPPISPLKKINNNNIKKKKKKSKIQTSMGDEVIHTRTEDQPILHRRSFSMDSAGDTQLLLAMQLHLKRDPIFTPIIDTTLRRPFFSFANGLSRSAVQPLCNF